MVTHAHLRAVSKQFTTLSGSIIKALNNISLTIEKGDFITVVGPSGSGKTTLLNILAGIERPTSGIIDFPDVPLKPRIGFVFQNNTVFPWRTVEKNLTYSLELQRVSKEQRRVG